MTDKRRKSDFEDMQPDSMAAAEDLLQFVSFTLGEQDYCVEIMAVREIKAWSGTTRLPNSPDYMRGVINLRGSIVPVVDLRLRFGSAETATTSSSVIIIVSQNNVLTGLLVDSVSDIISIRKGEISPIPELEQNRANPFFSGLVTVNSKLVAIVSLENLLVRETATQAPVTPLPVPQPPSHDNTFALMT